jgi:adenosylcobinamide-phosphate synthase
MILSVPDYILGSIAIAMLLDWFWGEPPVQFHPVVWMGRYLAWVANKIAPRAEEQTSFQKTKSFLSGLFFWCVGGCVVAVLAWGVQRGTQHIVWWLAILVTGFILNSLFSLKLLITEVAQVELALNDSLESGRAQLKRLVSRDVTTLNHVQIRESAIESLAENLNDSFIAPVFWFLVGGLPAAALYRFANTADAMWGYKGLYGRYYLTWFGKWTARVDDVLSWFPAHISTLFICLILKCFSFRKIYLQAIKTPSPNGGWPMSAMAIGLGIKLSKPGVYVLNPEGSDASVTSVSRACDVATRVFYIVMLFVVCAFFVGLIK